MKFSPQFEAFLSKQLQSVAELVVVLILKAKIRGDKVVGQRPHCQSFDLKQPQFVLDLQLGPSDIDQERIQLQFVAFRDVLAHVHSADQFLFEPQDLHQQGMIARAADQAAVEDLFVGCFGVVGVGAGWRLFDGVQGFCHVFLQGVDDANGDGEVCFDFEVHLQASVLLLAAGQELFVGGLSGWLGLAVCVWTGLLGLVNHCICYNDFKTFKHLLLNPNPKNPYTNSLQYPFPSSSFPFVPNL